MPLGVSHVGGLEDVYRRRNIEKFESVNNDQPDLRH